MLIGPPFSSTRMKFGFIAARVPFRWISAWPGGLTSTVMSAVRVFAACIFTSAARSTASAFSSADAAATSSRRTPAQAQSAQRRAFIWVISLLSARSVARRSISSFPQFFHFPSLDAQFPERRPHLCLVEADAPVDDAAFPIQQVVRRRCLHAVEVEDGGCLAVRRRAAVAADREAHAVLLHALFHVVEWIAAVDGEHLQAAGAERRVELLQTR